MPARHATITRANNRIEVRPGSGAWTAELDWQVEFASPRCSLWSLELAGGPNDGVKYSLVVEPLGTDDPLPRMRWRVEAHGWIFDPHHIVVIVEEHTALACTDIDDLLERASQIVRTSHHWIELLLRAASPMTMAQAHGMLDAKAASGERAPIVVALASPLDRLAAG